MINELSNELFSLADITHLLLLLPTKVIAVLPVVINPGSHRTATLTVLLSLLAASSVISNGDVSVLSVDIAIPSLPPSVTSPMYKLIYLLDILFILIHLLKSLPLTAKQLTYHF